MKNKYMIDLHFDIYKRWYHLLRSLCCSLQVIIFFPDGASSQRKTKLVALNSPLGKDGTHFRGSFCSKTSSMPQKFRCSIIGAIC